MVRPEPPIERGRTLMSLCYNRIASRDTARAARGQASVHSGTSFNTFQFGPFLTIHSQPFCTPVAKFYRVE